MTQPDALVADPLRILCVCTYNRTRSVLAGALLEGHCRSLGLAAEVATAGIMENDRPPTGHAIDLLAERGVDVRAYRSRVVSEALVAAADLVVTAEREHVVWIAGRWREAFQFTFVLPEIVSRAADVGGRDGRPMPEWLELVDAGRPRGLAYLEADDIADIADPTGLDDRHWAQTVARIDHLTHRLAELLR